MALVLDHEGFLRNLDDWNENVAGQLAANAGIGLTPAHWEVINLARAYHQQHNLFPPNRVLITRMRL